MISVIVPAWNAENTLERAVLSILQNRDKDTEIEVIIVDDGSTDSTPVICELLSQDENVRVVHTENHGPSAARNTGLQTAEGEYIGFVDSDDWVEPDLYKKLLKEMVVQQADLAACGVIHETEEGSFPEGNDGSVAVIHGQAVYYEILQSAGIRGYLWNKLFKKDLIKSGFDESIAQCEDLLFTAAYCEQVSKAVYIRNPLYHYVRKNKSDEYSYTERDLSLMDAFEKLYSLYLVKAPEYAYIPEKNALKTYIHFRARGKLVREKDSILLTKIDRGIREHFFRVMKEKRISLKTKGNICITCLFPGTILQGKRKLLQCRNKRGIWES